MSPRTGAHAGFRANQDPTHVNSLLKSTPSILPRDSRHRLSPSVGASSASGRKNIILTSTFTPPPSTAKRHGSYAIFSCTHHEPRSLSGMRARSSGLGSTFTPPPAKENRGFSTYSSARSFGTAPSSERYVDFGTISCVRSGSEYFDHVQYQFGWGTHFTSRSSRKSKGSSRSFLMSSSKTTRL